MAAAVAMTSPNNGVPPEIASVPPPQTGAATSGGGGLPGGGGGAGGPTQFSSLYVGDLHPDVTEAMLYEIFNSVGPVASIRVCRDNVSRKSLGYAYVNFHSVQDADRALDTLNYSSIKGRACRIMWSHRDPNLRRTGSGNIFVKNLDKSIDNKSLYDTFALFGTILSCKVAKDHEGRSRGYGFVHYETAEAAKEAILRVNGILIGEKAVYVGEFVKRQERDKPEITNFTNLYVKNFPSDFVEDDIKKLFEGFGKITSLAVNVDKKGRKFAFVNFEMPDEAKKAIDTLHEIKDYRLEEQKLEDGEDKSNFLYCQRAQGKEERVRDLRDQFNGGVGEGGPVPTIGADPRFEGINLYVKNLQDDMLDKELNDLFATFGTISSCTVMKDDKMQSKGFGFVCFKNSDDATKAVTEMHLKVIKGKPLYVGLAEKKDERAARLSSRYKGGGPMGGFGNMGTMAGYNNGYPGNMGGGGDMNQGMMKGGGKGMMGGGGGGPPGMMGGQGGGDQFMGGKGGPPGGQMFPQMMGYGPRPGMMMPPPRPGMMGGYPGGFPPNMGGMMPMNGMMVKGGGGGGGPGMMPGGGGGGPSPQHQQQQQQQQQQQRGSPPLNLAPGARPNNMQNMQQQQMGGKGPGGPMGGYPGGGMPMNGKGNFPPNMQGGKGGPGPQQQNQMMQQQQQQQQQATRPDEPLTAAALAAAPPGMQKQMLGEKLFPHIFRLQPELAGKITGMMLEMDNGELLILLESEVQLKAKIDEAMSVLQSLKK